jgi:Flp pilus assembly protein TadD
MSQMQQDPHKKIDEYLASHWDVESSYFDSLLRKDGNSAYLVGMKYYFISEKLGAEKAKRELEAEVKKRRTSGPYIDLAFATIETLSGDRKSALDILEQALLKDHNNKWCLYEKYQLTKNNAGIGPDVLERLLKVDPEFSRAKIEKAFSLDPISNCNEIILFLNQLPQTMRYADTESYLGDAYYFCDRPLDAESAYESSIRIKPTAEAYVGLANVNLYVNHDVEGAKVFYKKAVELDANCQPAIIGLAWSFFESGDVSAAESNFVRAYAIEKNEVALQDLILFNLKQKNYGRASAYIKEFENIFGTTYISAGYSLVIDLANSSEEKRNEKIEAYNKKYKQEGINFTAELFSELSENR